MQSLIKEPADGIFISVYLFILTPATSATWLQRLMACELDSPCGSLGSAMRWSSVICVLKCFSIKKKGFVDSEEKK